MNFNRIILLCVLLSLVSVVLFLPIQIPYSINGIAKILPARQWILCRGTDGELLTSTVDHINGLSHASRLYSFERGESVVLRINPSLKNNQPVHRGDTLAVLFASSLQQKQIELEGQLQTLTAMLRAGQSGDKSAVVTEARERLAQATIEYEKQLKVVERQKALFEKNLISMADYQSAADELAILSKAVDVRRAELAAKLSGEKSADIEVYRKQIAALQDELSFLQREMQARKAIIAPFDGRLERTFAADTLLILSKIDSAMAVMPVKLDQAPLIHTGEAVSLSAGGLMADLSGTVREKHPVMELVDGKQCILVLASLEHLPGDFISGIIAQSSIQCQPLPLRAFIFHYLLN